MFDEKQRKQQEANNLKIGRLGEKLGISYLKKKGYKIIEKNYRYKFDEIDIIGKSKKGMLVFFEVKTRKEGKNKEQRNRSQPEDNFTINKYKRIKRVCEMFSVKHPEMIKKTGWRIDLLAIIILTENGWVRIKHYKNALK